MDRGLYDSYIEEVIASLRSKGFVSSRSWFLEVIEWQQQLLVPSDDDRDPRHLVALTKVLHPANLALADGSVLGQHELLLDILCIPAQAQLGEGRGRVISSRDSREKKLLLSGHFFLGERNFADLWERVSRGISFPNKLNLSVLGLSIDSPTPHLEDESLSWNVKECPILAVTDALIKYGYKRHET